MLVGDFSDLESKPIIRSVAATKQTNKKQYRIQLFTSGSAINTNYSTYYSS
ncbi:MAG: hypothetical protein MJ200_01690 [Mycoplasmoidaceae bacterium]|nr:hypothetical protein [Mycoplasmoidaceae bacterium]